MVAEEEEGAKVVFIEEDQTRLEILHSCTRVMLSLKRKPRAANDKKSVIENTPTSFMPRGNRVTYAYSAKGTSNTHACMLVQVMLVR